MNSPLIYMPRLDVNAMPASFHQWRIQRFIQMHPQGHILAPDIHTLLSVEVTVPLKNTHWYCRSMPKRLPRSHLPQDASVELTVPLTVNDPALILLQQVTDWVPVRRLVLRRPTGTPLHRLSKSIETLSLSVNLPIWIDALSFGWDAVFYLATIFPTLQVDAVPDNQLWELVRLSIFSDRPLVIGNLDTARLKPFEWHPTFDVPLHPRRVANSLLVSGRSQ